MPSYKEAGRQFTGGPKRISKEAIQFLVNYDWPGNVREQENVSDEKHHSCGEKRL